MMLLHLVMMKFIHHPSLEAHSLHHGGIVFARQPGNTKSYAGKQMAQWALTRSLLPPTQLIVKQFRTIETIYMRNFNNIQPVDAGGY